MKLCPRCDSGYPDSFTTCPVHGILLGEIRDLKPGMLIRHTYRIVRKLGQGGMGAVYLADHILLAEPQVLKFLPSEMSQDEELTNRFLREVRNLRQVRHRNVVNAGNLEPAEDGTLFFSMEFVDGPDLRSFVSQSPQPFDVAAALEIARCIAEGLGAAHDKGLVHRDIKPENILMARDGAGWVPKIADFGIVATRENSRSTQAGTSMLTPLFAAPEQWLGTPGAQLDGRTDLYALGGVLFEMLTGESVFHAENYQGWSQAHLNSAPRPPSTLRPELANWKGLDELVLRLLAKDRNQRPRDVSEVLQLLDAVEYIPPKTAQPQPAQGETADPDNGQPVVAAARGRVALKELPGAALKDPLPYDTATMRPAHERRTLRNSRTQRVRKPQKQVPLWVWLGLVGTLISSGMVAERVFGPWVPVRVLGGQPEAVIAVAYSPNGLTVATASRESAIQLWDAGDGRALRTMQDSVESLAFSPDGRTLATGMSDNTIKLWDALSGQVLSTVQGHTDRIPSVAFSPDGKTFASGSWDRTIKIWDVAGGQAERTLRGHSDRVLSVTYSPDGRTLASASADGTVKLWDPATGSLVRSLPAGTRAVNSVAFSLDGRLLATGGDDMTAKLWDPTSGRVVRTLTGHSGAVNAVAFSRSGGMVASAGADGLVRLWDVASGDPVLTLKGHTAAVLAVTFSPFGHTLASAGADRTIRLWDVNGVGN
jgi:eukaryotic-like serine/threonine-protein kinase